MVIFHGTFTCELGRNLSNDEIVFLPWNIAMFDGKTHYVYGIYGHFQKLFFDLTRGSTSIFLVFYVFLWFSSGFPMVSLWFPMAVSARPSSMS